MCLLGYKIKLKELNQHNVLYWTLLIVYPNTSELKSFVFHFIYFKSQKSINHYVQIATKKKLSKITSQKLFSHILVENNAIVTRVFLFKTMSDFTIYKIWAQSLLLCFWLLNSVCTFYFYR